MTSDIYKQQAKRLSKFLKDRRGLELRHSETLEAIAAIHGKRNWNTLSAADSAVNESVYTVTIIGRGFFPHVSIARSLPEAMWAFLTAVHNVAALFRDDVELLCVGDDDDGWLSGMYLLETDGPSVLVAMQTPFEVTNMTLPPEDDNLRALERMGFDDVAAMVNQTLPLAKRSDLTKSRDELRDALITRQLGVDHSAEMMAGWKEHAAHVGFPELPQDMREKIWKAMRTVNYQVKAIRTVATDGSIAL